MIPVCVAVSVGRITRNATQTWADRAVPVSAADSVAQVTQNVTQTATATGWGSA